MSIINVRKSAFETNSSSVHALCINKSLDSLKVPASFTFERGGEFGWSDDTYTDSGSKGDYLYKLLCEVAEYDANREFEMLPETQQYMKENPDHRWWNRKDFPKFGEVCDNIEKKYKEQIENLLAEYGCKKVTWEPTREKAGSYNMEDGYLDHSSEACDFFRDMMRYPDLLISFLFGDATVYTGTDNADEDPSDFVNPKDWDYYYIKGN